MSKMKNTVESICSTVEQMDDQIREFGSSNTVRTEQRAIKMSEESLCDLKGEHSNTWNPRIPEEVKKGEENLVK